MHRIRLSALNAAACLGLTAALWTPVALGLGIAIYFELPSEPPLWLGIAIATLGIALCAARSAALSRRNGIDQTSPVRCV